MPAMHSGAPVYLQFLRIISLTLVTTSPGGPLPS